MYYVILGVLVICFFLVKGIHESRTGRAFMALRDNERAAEAYGLHAIRVRVVAFALSGGLAGVAGCLLAHQQQGLDPESFGAFANLYILTMVIIGGVTTPIGALIGAMYLVGTESFLPVRWQFLASGDRRAADPADPAERHRRAAVPPARPVAGQGREAARRRGARPGDLGPACGRVGARGRAAGAELRPGA